MGEREGNEYNICMDCVCICILVLKRVLKYIFVIYKIKSCIKNVKICFKKLQKYI